VVEAAITSDDVDEVVLHLIPDTGLSTLRDDIGTGHASSGWAVEDVPVPARRLDDVLAEHVPDGEEIHFLVVDVEGAERKVLESVDLSRWRPWVIVIEATAPSTQIRTHDEWEHLVVGAGYDFCLFDGLSRWYVAKEHLELAATLDHPACPQDAWVSSETYEAGRRLQAATDELAALRAEQAGLVEQIVRWRGEVLARWCEASAAALATPGAGGVVSHESARLRAELDEMKQTVSWRITAPLRDFRTAQLRRSRHA
jgi:hypothetical protein